MRNRNYTTLLQQRLRKAFSFIAFLGLVWLLFSQGIMVFHFHPRKKAKETTTTTTTTTVPLSPTSLLLKRYLKIIGRERHLDFITVSKRRVPNGPDPIHNRRAVKYRQPPGV